MKIMRNIFGFTFEAKGKNNCKKIIDLGIGIYLKNISRQIKRENAL